MPILGIMASQISGHLASIIGTTWTAGGSMPSTADWSGAAYGAGLFAVGDGAGTTKVATTPTGATWTARTLPSAANTNAVVFDNNIFMLFAYPNLIFTSSNGTSWSAATASTIVNPQGSCYGLGVFFTSENASTAAASSANNGSTWTARTKSIATGGSGAGNSSIIVTIGTASTSYSTNLTTWTTGTMPSSRNWYGTGYGNGLFISVAYTSGTFAATSTDGITWTARTLPTTTNWTTVYWGGANWIALGGGGNAATSTDGITWTARSVANYFYNQPNQAGSNRSVVAQYGGTGSQVTTS